MRRRSDYLPVREVNGTCKGARQGDFCRVSVLLCKRQSRIPDLSGTANLWENGGILSYVFKKGNHVRILENGSVLLPEYGIRITGLDLPREYYQKLDRAKLEPKAISRMVGHADQNDFQVLLAHNPVFF